MLSEREELSRILRKEREQLKEEVRRAPRDHDALNFWIIADEMSGAGPRRKQRLAEIGRDLFLLAHGYRLIKMFPLHGEDPRPTWTLLTLRKPRLVYRITEQALRAEFQTPDAWKRLLLQHAQGQQYLACRSCKEPILKKTNIEQAVAYLKEHASQPLYSLANHTFLPQDPMIEQLTRIEYRSVAGGPLSEPIAFCPNPDCCLFLMERALEEIRVAQD